MESSPWELEVRFAQVKDQEISVVFNTVVCQPGRHVCKTLIHNQLFLTDCMLQKGHDTHTVMKGTLQNRNGQWWLVMGPNTRTFLRPAAEMNGMYRIVDACSGIAAVSKGFEACVAQVLCHVQSSQVLHQWNAARSTKACTEGVFPKSKPSMNQQSHVLSVGISCQPFSGLGDGKQGCDPRSVSFTGIKC